MLEKLIVFGVCRSNRDLLLAVYISISRSGHRYLFNTNKRTKRKRVSLVSHDNFPLGRLFARVATVRTKAVKGGIGWEAEYFSFLLNSEGKCRFE